MKDTLDRRPRQIDFIQEILGRCSHCMARVGEHDVLLCGTCVSGLHAELLAAERATQEARQAIADESCPDWDDHDRVPYLRGRLRRLLDYLERLLDDRRLSSRDDDRLRDLLYELDEYL